MLPKPLKTGLDRCVQFHLIGGENSLPKLLDIPAVATVLGTTTSRGYELARLGILPVVRLGRQIRVDESKLREWIANGGQALPGVWKQDGAAQAVASLARAQDEE